MELKHQLVPQQRLELKPLLIQAVRLLPLTQLEIRRELLQEYLQNPALELTALEDIPSFETFMKPGQEDLSGDDDAWLQSLLMDTADEVTAHLDSGIKEETHAQDWIWERWIANPQTLVDHLRWQVAMLPVGEDIRQVCYFLIEFLNPAGYLEEGNEELARLAGVTPAQVETARRHLLHLDPPGVGARSLRECLLAQLEVAGEQDSAAYRLLSDAWDLVTRGQWDEIRRQFGWTEEELDRVKETIRHLEPRPARSFVPHQLLYIYPDVIVRKEGERYVVEVCRDLVPRFAISRRYVRMLRSGKLSPEEKAYLREKVLSARRLLKTLNYCESTLKRVARFIVEHQKSFFEEGIPGLKPLSLRQVADALNLHESTISRTVQHKYIQTPRGTFEMRFFFQRRLPTRDGAGGVATVLVRMRVKELIEQEDPGRPLTDEELTRLLRLEGIKISRRAVSKYRLEMKIPNARQRARRYRATR